MLAGLGRWFPDGSRTARLFTGVTKTLEHHAETEQTKRPHHHDVLDLILVRRATDRVDAGAGLGRLAASCAVKVVVRLVEVVQTQVFALRQRLW